MRRTALLLLLGGLTGLACKDEPSADEVIETYCRRCDRYPNTAEEDVCITTRKDWFTAYRDAGEHCSDLFIDFLTCMNDQPCESLHTEAAAKACADVQNELGGECTEAVEAE